MQKVPTIGKGSTIALLSLSWGGPAEYPWVYEQGVRTLRDVFGFEIREYPTTRVTAEYLREHPEDRANDLVEAFNDPEIDGIICTIGGNDAVRLLPFLDRHTFSPKFFMGYSDSTVLLAYLNQRDIVTFHGPSVMAGFAGLEKEPSQYHNHLRDFLNGGWEEYIYTPNSQWSRSLLDWSRPDSINTPLELTTSKGWRVVNAPKDDLSGTLWGGCIEALAFMQGGTYWPYAKDFWGNKIVMFELSDDGLSDAQYADMLRRYGNEEVFSHAKALLIGRFAEQSETRRQDIENLTLKVVTEEFKSNIPIVFGVDFGHTYPQQIFPLGCTAELSFDGPSCSLSVESPFKI